MAFVQFGFLHTEGVSSLAFNPHGGTLVSTSLDGSVGVWDATGATTAPVAALEGHENSVNVSAFFADGARLVTAGEDAHAFLWDLRNPSAPCATFKSVGAGVNRVAVSPSQALLYSASDDGCVVIHDVATGDVVDRFMVAGAAVNDIAVVPTGSLDLLFTATEDGGVRTWLGGTADDVRAYRTAVPRIREKDDDDDAGKEGDGGEAEQPEDEEDEADMEARLVDSVDDLEQAANVLHVRDEFVFVGTASCIFGLKYDPASGCVEREGAIAYPEHDDYVRGIVTTAAGAMYSCGDDALVVEWAPPAPSAVRRFKAHDDMIMALALSPAEDVLATGCEDSTVRLWKLPFTTQTR